MIIDLDLPKERLAAEIRRQLDYHTLAERARIRKLALDEADRHARQLARGFGPTADKALRDFAALLEER
jgi:hypothetical protein